jgi:rare lipoprotein A
MTAPRAPFALALRFGLVAALAAGLTTGCAHRRDLAPDPWPGREYEPGGWGSAGEGGEAQFGYASWYGGRLAGRRTADGEVFDPRDLTAAHRSLPFGTWVEVRRLETGGAVRVRITDRGPFGHDERIIDLSEEAARRLDMIRVGVAPVALRIVAGP